MNVIPAEKNPISPEPIMPGPVEIPEDFDMEGKVGCGDAITKEMEKRSTAHMLNEHPNDGLKAKCPICGGTNVHYKKGCLDCLKKKAIYEIRVENKLVGEITTTVDYLKKTYHTLNETGVFLFEDGTGSIIYLDQPKQYRLLHACKLRQMGKMLHKLD